MPFNFFMKAQIVDIKQYRDRRAGGRPCGGKNYNLFHPDSSTNNTSSSPPGTAPQGRYWKLCSQRGWILKKIKTAEQKQEKQTDNHGDNIDNLASEKKEIKKEEDPDVKDELSRIVKNDYTMMQREVMKETSYRKVQNYEELNKNNKKIAAANDNGMCPLCGSKVNHKLDERDYSKAA